MSETNGLQEITYSYTDTNGCWNADTQTYVVNQLPIPEFVTLNQDYCEDGAVELLNGSINATHPFGRLNSFYFGDGVTNTSVNNATFDPTTVPVIIPGGTTSSSISFVFSFSISGRYLSCLAKLFHSLGSFSIS